MALGLQATAVQDPSTEAAKFLKAMGFAGLDPSTTALMAGEAFGSQFTSPMAGTLIGERVQRAGLESALNQGGTGVGPAGDLARALFEAQAGMQRFQAQPRVGGRGFDPSELPLPVAPPLAPRPPTTVVGTTKATMTATKNAPKEPLPPELKRITDALRIAEAFTSEENQIRQSLATRGSGLAGAPTVFDEERIAQKNARFAGASSPAQAFWMALNDPAAFPELRFGRKPDLADLSPQAVGRETLRAWHGGDHARATEGLRELGRTRSFATQAHGRSLGQAMGADESKVYDRILQRLPLADLIGFNQGKAGVSEKTLLRAWMNPAQAAELLAELDAGADVSGEFAQAASQRLVGAMASQGARV